MLYLICMALCFLRSFSSILINVVAKENQINFFPYFLIIGVITVEI